jgi:predicted acylesterase/phospholipase RssA
MLYGEVAELRTVLPPSEMNCLILSFRFEWGGSATTLAGHSLSTWTTNSMKRNEATPSSASQNGQHPIEYVDLALSGGGFRATLFHLGVIGFLRSQGLLTKVETICSVSGGSILAAHMVTRWDEYTRDDPRYFIQAAEHLIGAIRDDDISLRALIRLGSVHRVLFRRALDSETLVDEYRRILGPTSNRVTATHGLNGDASNSEILTENPAAHEPITRWEDLKRLSEIRHIPDLQLLATHLNTATMCGFNREKFFISSNRDDSDPSVKGLLDFADGVKIEAEEIARAVAASSAFPPIFAPLPVIKGDSSKLHLLTDGGVYDNSGVKRLRELYQENGWTSHRNRLVVVSDAGRAFSVVVGQQFDTLVELATRVSDAQANRITKFDTDQTQEFFKKHNIPVLRCSIHETVQGASVPKNHSSRVQRKLGTIRTELDKFSDVEVFTLYRHGYLVARNQYLTKLQGLNNGPSDPEIWLPYKDSLSNRSREHLEKELDDSHEMKKIAWLRRIAFPLAAAALVLVLVLGALIGLWFGGAVNVIRKLPPPLETGTAYKINWIDRLELELLSTDFVLDGDRKWPYAYGSGLTYDQEVNGKYEFYMITDRGPAFEGPRTADGKTFKLYLDPNYIPHIARVQLEKSPHATPTVVESFQLHYQANAVEGLPPAEQAGKELTVGYVRDNAFEELPSRRFGIDPEDLALDSDGAFWISEEYRPAVMKAVRTQSGVVEIQNNILLPGNGLPQQFARARPNRGIESISVKNGWLFVALQGAFDKNPNVDGVILIARARLSELEQFVQNRTLPSWEIYKYAIPAFYKNPPTECSIGGIHAIDENNLLILEREVRINSRRAMINLVTLPNSPSDKPIEAVPVVDLERAGWVSEKPEGITLIDDRTIVISSDNDFGMLLEGVIELKVEHDSAQPIGGSQLPITNMDFFQTVAGSDGKYRLMCRIKGFEKHPLTLRPQDRAHERRPAFWVIHMKDSLIRSK